MGNKPDRKTVTFSFIVIELRRINGPLAGGLLNSGFPPDPDWYVVT
jgi:hypothetical protein